MLFVAAVVVGSIWGYTWNREFSTWATSAFVGIVADPNVQIASLGTAVLFAFALGLVHITSPCYAAGGAGGAAADANGSRLSTVAEGGRGPHRLDGRSDRPVRRDRRRTDQTAGWYGSESPDDGRDHADHALRHGLLMLVVALGELGLTRRLLPSAHTAPCARGSPGGRYELRHPLPPGGYHRRLDRGDVWHRLPEGALPGAAGVRCSCWEYGVRRPRSRHLRPRIGSGDRARAGSCSCRRAGGLGSVPGWPSARRAFISSRALSSRCLARCPWHSGGCGTPSRRAD